MQKESQTQFTLRAACNIVFQGNVVIFVLGTKTVSGEDSQMALVTVSTNTTVLVRYLEAVCAAMCTQVMRDRKSAGNFSRGSLMQGPCLQRAYVYMESGEQVRGQYNPPREMTRVGQP